MNCQSGNKLSNESLLLDGISIPTRFPLLIHNHSNLQSHSMCCNLFNAACNRLSGIICNMCGFLYIFIYLK